MIPTNDTLPTDEYEAQDKGWSYLGKGGTRQVFTHPDYPAMVLKVGHLDSNRSECHRWSTHRDSYLSPRLAPIFARSPEYDSLLMRREDACEREDYDSPPQEHTAPLRAVGIYDFALFNMAYVTDDYGDQHPARCIDYAF